MNTPPFFVWRTHEEGWDADIHHTSINAHTALWVKTAHWGGETSPIEQEDIQVAVSVRGPDATRIGVYFRFFLGDHEGAPFLRVHTCEYLADDAQAAKHIGCSLTRDIPIYNWDGSRYDRKTV